MASPSPWDNTAAVDRLKTLWADHSATEIAAVLWEEFRLPVSRNSVVGKLHRLKLTIEHKTEEHPKTHHRNRNVPRVPRVRSDRNTSGVKPEPFVCREAPLLEPFHLSLPELGPQDCRWPFGHGLPYTFCGHPKASRWYCAAHEELSIGKGTSSERAASRFADIGKGRGGVFGRVA